jgi:hypothetical protein
VESYLEQVHSHYSYGYITKYFYKTNKTVPETQKREFWDSIAFTNFLQNMHMSYQTLEYKENKDMFDNNIPAFMTLLDELQPEVIYVIDKAVKDCLCANEIKGLEYVDCNEDWQVPVYRFTYKLKSKADPQDILKEIECKLAEANQQIEGNKYKIFLDKINAINDMAFSVKDRNIDKVDKVLYSYALDKIFVNFLEVKYKEYEIYLLQKDIEEGLKKALKNLLQLEKDITLDIEEVITIINNYIPTYSKPQYMNDGVRIELFNALNATLDEESKMNEFNFIRAIGLKCKSERDWARKRKNEYNKQRTNKIKTNQDIESYLKGQVKDSQERIKEILNNK